MTKHAECSKTETRQNRRFHAVPKSRHGHPMSGLRVFENSHLRTVLLEIRCCACRTNTLRRSVTTLSAINRGIRASKGHSRAAEGTGRSFRKSRDVRSEDARNTGDGRQSISREGARAGKMRFNRARAHKSQGDFISANKESLVRSPFRQGSRGVLEEGLSRSRRKRDVPDAGQIPKEGRSINPGRRVDDLGWSPTNRTAAPQPRTDRVNGSAESPRRSRKSEAVMQLPYTTAASVFIYGYNSVFAALSAGRRKLYKLYIAERPTEDEGVRIGKLRKVALAAGVPVHDSPVSRDALSKISDARPHNGVVLEASRLPVLPIAQLGRPDVSSGMIPITLDHQSAEDAVVNGRPEAISCVRSSVRHPFIVVLDGVTDPENVGSILRTAYYYGVDAVAVALNTCANLSSTVLAKASSGACEAVQLLGLSRPGNFIVSAKQAGWRIYSANVPLPSSQPYPNNSVRRPSSISRVYGPQQMSTTTIARDSPLLDHPCILMLGAEGEGLRESMAKRADCSVYIETVERPMASPDVMVDSLNVGVAAGILMEAFQRRGSVAK